MIEVATCNGIDAELVTSFDSINQAMDVLEHDEILAIEKYSNVVTVWIK